MSENFLDTNFRKYAKQFFFLSFFMIDDWLKNVVGNFLLDQPNDQQYPWCNPNKITTAKKKNGIDWPHRTLIQVTRHTNLSSLSRWKVLSVSYLIDLVKHLEKIKQQLIPFWLQSEWFLRVSLMFTLYKYV